MKVFFVMHRGSSFFLFFLILKIWKVLVPLMFANVNVYKKTADSFRIFQSNVCPVFISCIC